MGNTDAVFAGSIPALYHRLMGPMLFEPYAKDLAARVAALQPRAVLETAAGTGILTDQLVDALPAQVEIVATDLNPAMLQVAAQTVTAANVRFEPADATALPFAAERFDVVVCQFGVMFFPDKLKGYSEALRVLRPAGKFLFNVWTSLDFNPLPAIVQSALAEVFPENPPRFMERTPHGHGDPAPIMAGLSAAGFRDISFEVIPFRSVAASAQEAAIAFCQGTPLRSEIEQRGGLGLQAATDAAAEAIAQRYGTGRVDAPMQALVFSALK